MLIPATTLEARVQPCDHFVMPALIPATTLVARVQQCDHFVMPSLSGNYFGSTRPAMRPFRHAQFVCAFQSMAGRSDPSEHTWLHEGVCSFQSMAGHLTPSEHTWHHEGFSLGQAPRSNSTSTFLDTRRNGQLKQPWSCTFLGTRNLGGSRSQPWMTTSWGQSTLDPTC